MPRTFRSFAIVPAAGSSQRMGAPKLTLPWGTGTLIEHVLTQWRVSDVDRVIMVVRPGDLPLIEIGQRLGTEVVEPPAPPADMKESVCLALRHLVDHHRPKECDAWLLAPADMPNLDTVVIDRLLKAYDPSRPATLIPVFEGRRGHPILLPIARAAEVESLPAGKGVNALVDAGKWVAVRVDQPGILEDLDTPEDYRRLR